LSGTPVSGFQAFPATLNAKTVGYVIESANGAAWEIGTGTFTHSGGTLTRTLRSSSTGALLSLSGTSTVFLSPNADDLMMTISVTIANSNFVIDGTENQTMTLLPSITYRLDTSALGSHPLKFSTDAAVLTNSTGATAYTTGITEVGTRGTAGAYMQVKLEQDAPTLYYYCSSHDGMGGNVSQGGTTYTLPAATASALGGVKIGSNLSIDGSGVLSASIAGGTDYSVTAYTASAGNTTFNASSSPALPAYSSGRIAAYVNGVKRNDITASNGSSVVFGTALLASDIVEIVNHGSGNVVLPPALGTSGQAIKVNSAGNGLEFAAAGGVDNVGTLTKTFTQNEEASITLSAAVSPVPVVSVFKEISTSTVISKGNWDVNSTGSNYTEQNLATSAFSGATLTPSAVGSGTFTLSTGSFATADIGKRVTGNGGVAIITAASGTYTTSTNFTNTNAIASGDWYLYGTEFVSDGSGVSLSGLLTGYNLGSGSLTDTLSVSSQLSGATDFAFNSDGTKMYFVDISHDKIFQYSLSTAYDTSTASYDSVSVSTTSGITNFYDNYPMGIEFKSDGTKMYILGGQNNVLYQFVLATAWDITSTSSFSSLTLSSSIGSVLYHCVRFKSDGTKMYIGHFNNVTLTSDMIYEYSLSTAWDVTTASTNAYGSPRIEVGTVGSIPGGFSFSTDGTKLFVPFYSTTTASSNKVTQFNLSTAWDLDTDSTSTTLTHSVSSSYPKSTMINPDGTKLYVLADNPQAVYEYSVGSSTNPTGAYFPTVGSSSGQIDTTNWTDINTMVAAQTAGGGTVMYSISTDNHVTWKVIHNTNGTRSIAKNNSGTWQINTNATYASETWANATTNNELSALQQALATTQNRMDKAQLDAVTDANHIALGATLDLMIAPYMASAGTAPVSDGVTINYVASAIYEQALAGTDYRARFPASTTVQIKSLAAQNLKVRVL
jgi:hypothetical protein